MVTEKSLVREEASTELPGPHATLRLIGVGTAGGRLVRCLGSGSFSERSLAVVLSPWDEPSEFASGVICVQMRGGGRINSTSVDELERARALAQEDYGRLVELCQGIEWVLLVAGLGGATGSGMTPVLARAAREAGARVLAVVFMPFQWEGDLRQRRAQSALEELRLASDGLVCVPNQKFLPLLPPRTPLLEVYERVNQVLALGLEAFGDALTQRGLIPLPLDNLCELLRGRHAESVFVTAQAEGSDRLEQLEAALMQHPLLDGGGGLQAATSVLVYLTGGNDLTAVEVEQLVGSMRQRAPRAEILVGAGLQPHWQNRLRVLWLVTRRGQVRGNGATSLEPSREHGSTPMAEGSGPAQIMYGSVARSTDTVEPRAAGASDARNAGNGSKCERSLPSSSASRQGRGRWQQGTLPLDVATRGRFEKTRPNIHRGEDLDVPTFIRRGIVLD